MSDEKKPIIVFERPIPKTAQRKFEEAGYSVVCTRVPFKMLSGGENLHVISGMALDFLATGGYDFARRDFAVKVLSLLNEQAKNDPQT